MSKHHKNKKFLPKSISAGQASLRTPVTSLDSTLVDVCILTAGRFDLLRTCIDRSIDACSPFKSRILLLDNGSPHDEFSKNSDLFEKVKQTKFSNERGSAKHLQENGGFPKGANELFKMGTAPLIMYISDDVFVTKNAIDVLLRRMDDATIGLCGMKLLFPPDANIPGRPAGKVQHIGHGVNIRGEITHPLIGWSSENPKCNVSREVFSVTGAAFIVRRKLFNQVGGFSEEYGLGTYEDVELCLRIRQLGYKIFIDTEAVGFHYVGASLQLRKEGFPLLFNSMLFNSRWAGKLAWTEWEMY